MISPGDVISNDELRKEFAVGNMGGMRRSIINKCLVIVSDATKSLYDDRWESADVIHYTGMGPSGDQDVDYAQNKTLANSATNGVTVHLFEVFTPNNYVYAGVVDLIAEPYQEPQVGEDGNNRLVYMFPLKLREGGYKPQPVDTQVKSIAAIRQKSLSKKSMDEIKRRAESAPKNPPKRTALTEVIIRSDAVVEHVKRLASGVCDLCEQPAPFKKKSGDPYLECHHIIRLADDGDDSIENAVALCPNCHRKMHSLNRIEDVRKLKKLVLARN